MQNSQKRAFPQIELKQQFYVLKLYAVKFQTSHLPTLQDAFFQMCGLRL